MLLTGFPGGSVIKNPPANTGDGGSIPGSGRSPGEGNGNLLQYSCLEIPWTEEPGGLVSTGSRRIRYDRAHTNQPHKQRKKYQEKRDGYSSHPVLYEQNSTIALAYIFFFSSVQYCRSVVSDSLQLHGLQQARLPCPSQSP